DFCSPFFTVQAYKQTYAGYIKPMNDMADWSTEIHVIEGVPQIINPPPHVRGIGRPKKQRRREEDEDAPSSKKKMTYKSYHLPGHNSMTCKGLPANIAKNANKEKEATTKKASTDKSKKDKSNTSKENCGTNGGGGVVDTTAAASSSQSNTPTSMFVVPTTKAPNIMPHLTSSRSPAFQPSFSTIHVQSRQKMTSVRPPNTPSNGQSYRNQSI
ncbi:hypothetical protein IFM89_014734, partial [Coptis chinensis]